MVFGQHFAQAHARVEGVRVLGSSRHAETAASPDAQVPGMAVERLVLRRGDTANEHNQKNTTETQRHRETRCWQTHQKISLLVGQKRLPVRRQNKKAILRGSPLAKATLLRSSP